MIIYNYLDAIKRLVPKSEFNFPDLSDLGSLDWRSDPDLRPTDEAIEESLIQLNEEYDAQEYARNRATEYPSTGDQLDYIFHNGVAKWKTDMIEPVKAKYPKPA